MNDILVVVEHLDGKVKDITMELIGAAVSIKEEMSAKVIVLVIANDPETISQSIKYEGVDEIVMVPIDIDHFDPLLYEDIIIEAGKEINPRLIMLGHTVNGMACAAAVAARLGSGFASDIFDLCMEDNELIVTRSAYNNKVNLELGFVNKGIVTLTLRGATFPVPVESSSPPIRTINIDVTKLMGVSVHKNYEEVPPADIDISKAEFILSVGRGIQDEENLPRFAALAENLGATFGCSRPIVDSGWLPKAHQVGQSGKTASDCKLYFALGISGAVQHQHGMKHVETIIAVNTDPDAPIFNVATYGACLDIFELADALEAGQA